ncbi:hypothetical protein GF359_09715 [candidate division WOR-3 bacterium]|uniref:Polymer-forming cytoskeletal protein n=1 Tax=candidate division WOR-3 bacterium TaxID=2052148 RepID=A0A9D5KAN6_UNCW3|nr:hypothetical protein [candidate division WOR-3 bacterium]MBD3365476.1 hypothetical protein [candidate division WOR-3 bacterium]
MKKLLGFGVLAFMTAGLSAQDIEVNPWDLFFEGEWGAYVKIDSAYSMGENLVAMGALVEQNAPVPGYATMFGGQVKSHADVDGNLLIGAAVAEVSGSVGGKANVGGAVVYLSGTFTDSLEAGGGVVFVSGHIKGPVSLAGAEIFIQDGAIIEDTLRYDAGKLHIADGALLKSGSRRVIIEAETEIEKPVKEKPQRTFGSWLLKTIIGFFFLAGAGIFLALVFRTHLTGVTSRIIKKPGLSALTGFIALAAALLLPIILGLLAATIAGIGAALFISGLYFVGFVFSVAYAGTTMGRWLLSLGRKKKKEPHIMLSVLLGTFIAAILCGLPYVGWVFYLASFIFGFGGFLVHLWLARKLEKVKSGK